jgi:tRNA G26 N,N-dimethylase Trm1
MTKTKAEQLREITTKAQEQARAERIARHKKYVDKIISKKLYFFATIGRTSAKIKVRRKYSPTLVIEQFANNGFEIKQTSKNGRAILILKW